MTVSIRNLRRATGQVGCYGLERQRLKFASASTSEASAEN